MLITNTLFRLGGAAVLLSNKTSDKYRAKFKLEHVVRTHMGSNETAFGSVFQEEDAQGIVGVRLSKQISEIAGKAIKKNIMKLGPKVLPLSQQLKYAWTNIFRRFFFHFSFDFFLSPFLLESLFPSCLNLSNPSSLSFVFLLFLTKKLYF